MNTLISTALVLITSLLTLTGHAQKSMGETSGLSRRNVNPELLDMEGVIKSIEQGPCKYSTGESMSGTHLLLITKSGLLNIHLVRTQEVSAIVSNSENQKLFTTVFRTSKLLENHYIVKELTLNVSVIV